MKKEKKLYIIIAVLILIVIGIIFVPRFQDKYKEEGYTNCEVDYFREGNKIIVKEDTGERIMSFGSAPILINNTKKVGKIIDICEFLEGGS